ncbi:monovalent cation/H+ antiporter complex subunit F [endosymbiont of Ridgeia piscesae]|jgi:multisubunit Na+/H+ antiporter MnhF subunit|uniref:Multicomponent Na+:H+ antiporter subunit F n=1 Tax=endosymbiont of Ridgeia piscesae TaxID=54398 RepID=A0A0T5YZZ2_9GAMM|nr:monovalent cation/H+ antiporter complex subunit F [endosymbiont of Ridgeia piscesae]KRT56218.1 Multisubunit Na+/H+ antiporter, MnhF subunit [endosymbiont of Ridgeia piscesae]KRT59277.1 multicomponent Na+:H+ antiporter subunit F [endosymbiont of Ridgeia piscesae]
MTLSVLEKLALFLIGAAVVLSFLRLLIGPAAPDRVVAADTLAVITTSALLMLAALFGSVLYLDVALIYGTLAFVGVVAIARAIEGGRP